MRRVSISGRRSLPAHNMFFVFLNVVYENQEEFGNLTALRNTMFLEIGHGTWQFVKIGDETMQVFIPGSMSFENMGKESFDDMSKKAYAYIYKKYGIDVEVWKKMQREGKCANPDCENMWTGGVHHIFSGAYREISEKLGYVIKLCHKCHTETHKSGNSEPYQRKWVECIGLDYNVALRAVKTGLKGIQSDCMGKKKVRLVKFEGNTYAEQVDNNDE